MVAIFPACTTGGGQSFAFPDVCLTPMPPPVGTVPVPYPNTAMISQAKKTSKKVKFAGKPVVTKKSEMSRSMGDEPGTNKGVMSGQNMGPCRFMMGSTKVKVEGSPVTHLTSITAHNGMNANNPAGAVVAPGQTKVIVSP